MPARLRRIALEKLEDRRLLSVDPFPVPSEAVEPLGSLIYGSSVSAEIEVPAETDGFTIDLDDGQRVTLVADPDATLQPTIELFDPDNQSLGSATAGAAGQDAVLQVIAAPDAGTYTATVGGAQGTVGGYTVQLVLGAAVEEESHHGPANNEPASAQDLDAGFVTLAGQSGRRGAVLGALASSEDWYRFTLGDGEPATLALTALTPGEITLRLYDGSENLLAAGVAAGKVDQVIRGFVDATADGGPDGYYARVSGQSAADYSLLITGGADFDVEPYGGLGSDSREIAPSRVVLGRSDPALGNTATEQQRLTASDGEMTDRFGNCVSISGRNAIVGAPRDQDDGWRSGSAYIFQFDGSQWAEYQKLTASDADSGDYFGRAVAIDGHTAIVGAWADEDRARHAGSAYVFQFDGSQWVQQQKLTASDADEADYFGDSVAISGDEVIVGAWGDEVAGPISGSAYVFRFDGTQWIQQQKLTGSDAAGEDKFGLNVAIDGDFALVGAEGDDEHADRSGAAYVYWFDGSQWIQQQKLTADDAADAGLFGASVSIRGQMAIVGASGDAHAGWGSGAAYVFQFDGSQWRQQQKLTASDGSGREFFGTSASIDPGAATAIVGCSSDNDGALEAGSAYVFQFDGSRWQQRMKLTTSDPARDQALGLSVSLSGETAIAGAPGLHNSEPYLDSAFLFAVPGGDNYAIHAEAGDPLLIRTATPADGPGEFVNQLDPTVELYDPHAVLVAGDDNGAPDGRNASLSYTAAATGTYTVRLRAAGQTEGEYVLEVGGAGGALPQFEVTTTDPADGDLLGLVPAQLTVEFNDSVLASSLDASDLTVDGVPATAATVLDGDTVVFDLPALPSVVVWNKPPRNGRGEGVHNVAIASGAVLDLQGTPNEPFAGQFRVDLTAPRVIGSSLSQGDVLAVGTLTYTARFDEELDASNLDRTDVRLVGLVSGTHVPADLAYDSAVSTLTLQFVDLQDDAYTLTLPSGDGRFEDLVGHDLDGEPDPAATVPSGDGVAGGDFVVNFSVDIDSMPFPRRLEMNSPRGSLIHETSVGGAIGAPGDTDGYTIDLDDGQTITVVVDPDTTLQPTVVLLDPDGRPIGSVADATAGEDAVLQVVSANVAGTYTVTLGGLPSVVVWNKPPPNGRAGTGGYAARLILGAAVELEEHDGPANDEMASAQDLDGSFLALGDGLTRRGAVLGTMASTDDWYRLTLGDGETATLAVTSTSKLPPSTPPDLRLELYDGGQNCLATGVPAENLDQVIHNFVDTTHNGDPDAYFVRVSGFGRDYSLLAVRGGDFDAEPNSDLATAQLLPSTGAALGYLAAPAASPLARKGVSGGANEEDSGASAGGDRAAAGNDGRLAAAGGGEYVPGRLIVRFADAATDAAKAEVVEAHAAKLIRKLPLIDAAVVELPDAKTDLLRAAARWSTDPAVLYAEPDYLVHALDTLPDDPSFHELWGLHNTGQTGGTPDADIDAPRAWDFYTGSSGVVVAGIDTGVDYYHGDLAANMWTNPGEIPGDRIDNDGNGYVDDVYGIDAVNGDTDPMDDEGHGTHTAGTIGAAGDNGFGVTGVNWNVQIMATKFLDHTGSGVTSDAVVCLGYITMMKTTYGVNVVATNNSWGGGGFSQALYDAIQASNEAGIMFVAAAGNNGEDTQWESYYPATYDLDGIIAVAATDHNDQKAEFSNYGVVSVDLGAPGVDILSTSLGNSYAVLSGTSMAAPHVAGAVALLGAYHPSATLAEVKAAILDGADPVPALAEITVSGGRLNLAGALAALTDPGDYYRIEIDAADTLIISTSTPGDGPLLFENLLDPALELYDPSGRLLAGDDNGAPDGRNARLTYQAAAGGTYTVRVLSAAARGQYVLNVFRPRTAVVGRHVFYNNSAFDAHHPDANQDDDNAIAPDKVALLPGGTAAFSNYTSYSRGINGIMIDIAGLPDPPTLDANDFRLRMGNSHDPDGWAPAPDPSRVTVRRGAGTDDCDRVTMIWPDNTIQKQWLQVTVLANVNTGLVRPDVFYFGNAMGESGNSTTDAKVNAYDMLGARDHQRTFINPASIDFNYDFNRDQRVNAYDMLIARDNQTHFLNALELIAVPGTGAGEAGTPELRPKAVPSAAAERVVGWGSQGREASSGRFGWLYEFEPMTATGRQPDRNSIWEAAVDRLLTADSP